MHLFQKKKCLNEIFFLRNGRKNIFFLLVNLTSTYAFIKSSCTRISSPVLAHPGKLKLVENSVVPKPRVFQQALKVESELSRVVYQSGTFRFQHHNFTQVHAEKRQRRLKKKGVGGAARLPFQGSLLSSKEVQHFISEADTVPQITTALEKHRFDANHVNIASAIHKAAKVLEGNKFYSLQDEKELRKLLVMCLSVIDSFQPRQLCNIIWSLGKLRVKNKEFLCQMATRLLPCVQECKPEELAMVAWAFSNLRLHSNLLFEEISNRVVQKPELFSSRNLALIIWSFAANDYYNLELMERVSRLLVYDPSSIREKFSAKDMSMLAWSFVMQCQHHWKLQPCTKSLLAQISQELVENDKIREFSPHDLAQISVAFAKLGFLNESVLASIAKFSIPNIHQFNNQEKSNLAWAFARLYSSDCRPLFEAIAESAKPTLSTFNTQELANLAWSFVLMEVYDEEFLCRLFDEASKKSALIADEELRQFYQAFFVLKEDRPNVVAKLPRRFLELTKSCWALEKMREKDSSARHSAVSDVLNGMGLFHHNEGENDIDIALNHKKFGKVALEIDGPAHFSCNTHQTLGHTHLKHRILQIKGWQVVQIPYFEWDKIPFWSSMEKKRYLQRKLQMKENLVYSKNDWSSFRAYPAQGQTNRFD